MESRIAELERRVDLLMRGLNLLLEEGEEADTEELQEIRTRLADYLKGRRDEFVELSDVQGTDTQEDP